VSFFWWATGNLFFLSSQSVFAQRFQRKKGKSDKCVFDPPITLSLDTNRHLELIAGSEQVED
jgi:hypothetical protein